MADEQGNRLTNHTVGDVWTWVIAQGVESIEQGRGLDAIAPTVLKLMDIEIPQVMSKPLF
jgi:2,3-bisphosphoglycerate-independent phosphoglycerate mutase